MIDGAGNVLASPGEEQLTFVVPPRARRGSRRKALLDLDGVLSFTLIAAALFTVRLGTYSALLFSVVTISYAALRPAALQEILRNRWFFFLFPAFALLSTIWSDTPPHTLKHATEFLLTIVAALLLSSSRNPRATLFGLFSAFALFTVISLAVGTVVDVGDSGTTALSGLNDSKNQQADVVATGFLVTTMMFWLAWKSRSWLQVALSAGVGCTQIYATIAAQSVGAVIGLAVAMGIFSMLLLLRGASRKLRAVLIGIAASVALGTAAVILAFGSVTLDGGAALFGKDATLTGRTYLWARASEMVAEQPVLGRGFAAFWQRGNLDAEGLWKFAHITSRDGFNFHNTAYDILISLGWIGLLIFALTMVVGFGAATSRYISKPTVFGCFWLSIGAYFGIRMAIETIGIYEFYFSTVLLFALFGWSFADRRVNPLPGPFAFVVPAAGSGDVDGSIERLPGA